MMDSGLERSRWWGLEDFQRTRETELGVGEGDGTDKPSDSRMEDKIQTF